MGKRKRARAEAWTEAVQLHAHLAAGGPIVPIAVAPTLVLDHDEYALGEFSSRWTFMCYERLVGATVAWSVGPTFAVGRPAFVAATMIGAAARRELTRIRAEREAAVQWRTAQWHRTVLTTRRLWCTVAHDRQLYERYFDYDTINGMELRGRAMTLTFEQSPALRLTGDWAPWCATVIAHSRFGNRASQVVPELDAAMRSAAQAQHS
jgi:hypothetical protein